eukprot:1155820-Pelagomonas_calceolata.AAC.3
MQLQGIMELLQDERATCWMGESAPYIHMQMLQRSEVHTAKELPFKRMSVSEVMLEHGQHCRIWFRCKCTSASHRMWERAEQGDCLKALPGVCNWKGACVHACCSGCGMALLGGYLGRAFHFLVWRSGHRMLAGTFVTAQKY